MGPTANFYPDFLIWQDSTVFLVDTKGDHLIGDAVSRKLLNIRQPKSSEMDLAVRFVSKGKWRSDVVRQSASGYTVWGLDSHNSVKVQHVAGTDEVVARILA